MPIDKKGRIEDDTRVRKSIPTIKYLAKRGARVIIVSHFGNPKETRSMAESEEFSLLKKLMRIKKPKGSIYPIKKHLSIALQKSVEFSGDCIGAEAEKKVSAMKDGDVLLLENLRFYKEEKENSKEFAEKMAVLADIYINDAFSVCHREHASVYQMPFLLQSAAGMLLKEEVDILRKIKENSERPMVAVIGGAKVSSKIRAIKYFSKEADYLLLGGVVANAILTVNRISLNTPWPKKETVEVIKETDFNSSKIILPTDVIVSSAENPGEHTREVLPEQANEGEDIFDIGEKTANNYTDIIKKAKTIIWAGPLGLFEESKFSYGTAKIADSIARNESALKVAGGGDTLNAISKMGLSRKMDHLFCGGGAMLAYLSGERMPGLEGLNK